MKYIPLAPFNTAPVSASEKSDLLLSLGSYVPVGKPIGNCVAMTTWFAALRRIQDLSHDHAYSPVHQAELAAILWGEKFLFLRNVQPTTALGITWYSSRKLYRVGDVWKHVRRTCDWVTELTQREQGNTEVEEQLRQGMNNSLVKLFCNDSSYRTHAS
jgi:hypothetical protein